MTHPPDTIAAATPAPVARVASVTGGGPVACLVARMLTEDGWHVQADAPPAALAATWLVHIASDGATEPSPILTHARTLAQDLPAGGTGGVILILDVQHWQPRPGDALPPLQATLAQRTLWSLAHMLALELAPRLRVNAVGLEGLAQAPEPRTAEDMAAALRFIIDAPALTGQMIALDGGRTALVPAFDRAP